LFIEEVMIMTLQDEKRRSLLGRLSRQLGYTAPALLLAASGAAFQAVASETPADASYSNCYTNGQEAPLMLAEAHEEDAEAEGEGEGEGEAEGEGEGEAEG
jgi:H+/gluconate symporter-like permease